MPLTKAGNAVMKSMVAQYGPEKGAGVFYASINKGVAGSKHWHRKPRKEQLEITLSTAIARFVPGPKKRQPNVIPMRMCRTDKYESWWDYKYGLQEGGPGSGRHPGGGKFFVGRKGTRWMTPKKLDQSRVPPHIMKALARMAHQSLYTKFEGGPGSGRHKSVLASDPPIRDFARNMFRMRHSMNPQQRANLRQAIGAIRRVRDTKAEGGPGSGRYKTGSGEHAEPVRKLNLLVQRAVAAKAGKQSVAYHNAAMAVRARLAGHKPTAYGTVRNMYQMNFNYRPQLAGQDCWYNYIHEER